MIILIIDDEALIRSIIRLFISEILAEAQIYKARGVAYMLVCKQFTNFSHTRYLFHFLRSTIIVK